MEAEEKKEIIGLLADLIIFDLAFKRSVIRKADAAEKKELMSLKDMLREAAALQKNILEAKAKANPAFLKKLLAARKKAGASLLDLKKETMAAKDKKKIDIILSKLHSL